MSVGFVTDKEKREMENRIGALEGKVGNTQQNGGGTGSGTGTGKTAYEYAQDGGYTGTEEEFAAKLAQENPTMEQFKKLSNEVAALRENAASIIAEMVKSMFVETSQEAYEELVNANEDDRNAFYLVGEGDVE